jgi:hypothetical protein
MKTSLPPRASEKGSAVLVILILLTIMLLLSQANTLALYRLEREVKMVEKQQIHRWASPVSQVTTNQPAAK